VFDFLSANKHGPGAVHNIIGGELRGPSSPMSLQQSVYRQMGTLLPADSRTDIITRTKGFLGELKGTKARSLKLPKVQTYFASGKTLQTSSTFTGVVVPAFAPHWGVVVGHVLYHLTFRNPGDAESESSGVSREGCPINLTIKVFDEDVTECKTIGESKYDSDQLILIGRTLIKVFGSYHRLFWNCQVFAECFLNLITDGESFGEYDITYSILIY
jgi:hypothetical protein